MPAFSLKFLHAGPPPPKVALLPDALFFARAVPVPAAAGPDGEAGVAAQVELALEAASPFPLAQLYYGYFWVPASGHALAFAAYRRRFTAEQVAAWEGVQLVLPTFAALLGAAVPPATTVVLSAPEGLTAIHWGDGPVPTRVAFQALPPESAPEAVEAARAALLRSVGGTKTIVDLASPPAVESSRGDREAVFRSGDFVSTLSAEAVVAADVRDKAELAALERSQRMDVIVWRVVVGCVAAFAVMALGELALVGGGMWQKTRLKVIRAQAPVVDTIMTAQALAHKIDELSTKRLLPLEMISLVHPQRLGMTIQFLRASTSGLYTLMVEAQTSNPSEISSYKNKLEALPACDKVEIRDLRTQNNIASFTLMVTFKPAVLKPAGPAS